MIVHLPIKFCRVILILTIFSCLVFVGSCSNAEHSNSLTGSTNPEKPSSNNNNPDLTPSPATNLTAGDSQSNEPAPETNPAKSPTEAYKKLFAAVKSGNTDAIKSAVSQRTQGLADMLAKRQNEPIEKVYANGFTRTTMTDRLPEIRDERVKGLMGAVEVWSTPDQRWEDVPFIFENGSWKLAYGDLWQNVWQSPGPGRATLDAIAANSNKPNAGMRKIELPKNVNATVNPVPMPARKQP